MMRQQILHALPLNILAEKVPLANKDGENSLKSQAVVWFENLPDLILHYPAKHKATSTLSWHDGALPHGRLLVKIGGDHGGGSLKLSFQLGNVTHPNSIKSTNPFLVAAAKDSASNVATSLLPYSRQIASLQELTAENKSTQVTFFVAMGSSARCMVFLGQAAFILASSVT